MTEVHDASVLVTGFESTMSLRLSGTGLSVVPVLLNPHVVKLLLVILPQASNKKQQMT